jgi:hypothetical protein
MLYNLIRGIDMDIRIGIGKCDCINCDKSNCDYHMIFGIGNYTFTLCQPYINKLTKGVSILKGGIEDIKGIEL